MQQSTYDTKREFTDEDMHKMISTGYIKVHPDLWDRIPKNAHVRYVKKDTGENLPEYRRFKTGGYVKGRGKNGQMLIISNMLHGTKDTTGFMTFSIPYEHIETLWKKYDYNSFIETHLTRNSLSKHDKHLSDLQKTIDTMQQTINKLEEQIQTLTANITKLEK